MTLVFLTPGIANACFAELTILHPDSARRRSTRERLKTDGLLKSAPISGTRPPPLTDTVEGPIPFRGFPF